MAMQPILYLSEAQHKYDNEGCVVCNSENGHCKSLMDLVEAAVKRQGWTYKRVPPDQFGNLEKRCKESNDMGANIHFVIHTNSGGGSNERMHVNVNNAKSKAAGETFVAARTAFWAQFSGVTAPAVKDGSSLYEVKNTNAICLYDECLFHDNDANMRVFHGNMEANAENMVKALAAVFEVGYTAPPDSGGSDIAAGDRVTCAEAMTVTAVNGGTATLTAPVSALTKLSDGSSSGGSSSGGSDGSGGSSPVGIAVGDTVYYSGRLYATSTGTGAGKTVSGEFKVTRVIAGRSHGVLLGDDLGWVAESEVRKVG